MALIITGFLSGIIGGMGIGGGTILIPIMTIFLGFDQKTAQAVNLIYFIPTALTALTIHIKNKQIEKNNLWLLIVFGIIGTIIGTLCALKPVSYTHLDVYKRQAEMCDEDGIIMIQKGKKTFHQLKVK